MQALKIEELAKAVSGHLLSRVADVETGVTTDSRGADLTGKLFFPLAGENFNGHDFVPQAVNKGVNAVVVHEWRAEWEIYKSQVTFVQVADTLLALQQLANYWRHKAKAKIIAVTGSNGKTTTKDFTAQILSLVAPTAASKGSFNNHWGVPLSLLSIDEDHDFAVIEMGMNNPGEIAKLVKIAEPDVATVVNVGRAHYGRFNELADIAAAKREIYQFAPADCRFVFNVENKFTAQMYKEFGKETSITFATNDEHAQVFLHIEKTLKNGYRIGGHMGHQPLHADVAFWGIHNVQNLAAAAALCSAVGIETEIINDAFAKCTTGWGRNQWLKLRSGAELLFDAYNANPDSFAALVKNLKPSFKQHARRIGIFGEMLEMGSKAPEVHRELGAALSEFDWDLVVFLGPSGEDFRQGWQAKKNDKNLVITDRYEQILDLDWATMLNEKTFVVVKGSRGQRLERVVEHLQPENFSAYA